MFSVKTEIFSFVTSDAFSTLCQPSALPQKADTLLRVKWLPDLQLTALCQGEAKQQISRRKQSSSPYELPHKVPKNDIDKQSHRILMDF